MISSVILVHPDNTVRSIGTGHHRFIWSDGPTKPRVMVLKYTATGPLSSSGLVTRASARKVFRQLLDEGMIVREPQTNDFQPITAQLQAAIKIVERQQ